MRKITWLVVCLGALSFGTGCETDYYAKQVLMHDTAQGGLALDLTGSGAMLIDQKRIDLNPRLAMTDGTEIDVWVIKARPDTPGPARATALLLHGLKENKAKYLGAGERLAAMGYDVVLLDFRAHGRSNGEYVTYGAHETKDVKEVMDQLIGAGTVHGDMYVFGATLGAATAVRYAAIDPRVKGIVALTPYKDAPSMARRVLFGAAPTMGEEDFQTVLARAGQLADFDPQATSTVEAARKVTCPLLLVHAILDLGIPIEDSQAIYAAAAGPKELQVVTPGPEQILLASQIALGGWVPEKLNQLATKGLAIEPPAPAPAPAPAAGT